ncbi:hypothetical protein M199_gp225 [Halogranum tailed virus 1]|uniref:Uncharacterized protein n=1 Tax=Halogranum tailed virus 1 TaxID=1273749 RepID=R4TGR8_9CAUD|nr:hypothetical protein M199_gp225 [Halogranum tailed virus 1]AGM11441.1 hypothetical protein HGTV1_144 [Halogranum tailed virus 1]
MDYNRRTNHWIYRTSVYRLTPDAVRTIQYVARNVSLI